MKIKAQGHWLFIAKILVYCKVYYIGRNKVYKKYSTKEEGIWKNTVFSFLYVKQYNIWINTVLSIKICVIDLLRNHEKIKQRAESNKPIMETKWNTKNNLPKRMLEKREGGKNNRKQMGQIENKE